MRRSQLRLWIMIFVTEMATPHHIYTGTKIGMRNIFLSDLMTENTSAFCYTTVKNND